MGETDIKDLSDYRDLIVAVGSNSTSLACNCRQWAVLIVAGHSADIGAELAKAAAAEILKEATEIPNTDTLAILRDPHGAVFALWKCPMSAPSE